MKRTSLVLAILIPGLSIFGADGPSKVDKSEVKDVGLSVALRSKKESYKLDLAGKSVKEWEELLAIGKKLGTPPPKPPSVDMELEIKNTGKESVDFWSAGDPVQIVLELKGPRAKTITAPLAFTADFRLPKLMTLEPGKSLVLPIKSLQSGFRGIGTWHYWLEAGEYTITPSFKTGVSPAPPGTKEMEGAGAVTLVGKATSVKVVE